MTINVMKKAFQSCDKCIVLAANEQYVPYMSVALQSIYDHSDEKNLYDIIILHKDVTPQSQHTLLEMIEDRKEYISLRFMNVASYVRSKHFYTKNRANFSDEAYYRLMIPWLLEAGYKYALYIDGDMVIKRDIYELFQVDLDGNMLGAIKDYWGICNCFIPGDGRREYRESIGLYDIEHYVISSTLIFDLKMFRRQCTLASVLKLAQSRKWLQHDQDVINTLCQGKICYISAKWGYIADWGNNHYLPQYMQDELELAKADIAVVHYAGRRKPWKYTFCEYDMDFWHCAEETPYFQILFKKNQHFEYLYYVASKLNGNPLVLENTEDGMQYVYKDIALGGLNQGHARYRVIDIHKDVLHLEGMVGVVGNFPNAEIKVCVDIDGNKYWADRQIREDDYREELDYTAYRGEAFVIDVPLKSLHIKKKTKIRLLCMVDGEIYKRESLGFERYCILCRRYKHSYGVKENWILQTDRKYLYIRPFSHLRRLGCELHFIYDLLCKKCYKAIAARIMAALAFPFYRRPIWLISDRVERADDNGEAFFKYLNKEHKKEINSYFAIGKESPDYVRMQQYGKVVSPFGLKYKILQLLAEFSVSSQTDRIYRSSFYIMDSYGNLTNNVKFIFLQHGVIVADLTRWLNKRNQQLSGFITSTTWEYQDVMSRDYGYSTEVWLTGMPRYDYLQDNREKIITVAPTWRKYLASKQNKKTGVWNLVDDFEQSEYVHFYRNLMQNQKLRTMAKKYGYRILFKVHPAFQGYQSRFGFDDQTEFIPDEMSYREMYEKSSLMITDYSSSIFDFLYLGKPIIYTHFDFDEFYAGKHIYDQGDFDYQKEGFGEVEYTLEGTVDRIIEYMERDCEMKPLYKERVDRCFKYRDHNNSERIYQKMIELRN